MNEISLDKFVCHECKKMGIKKEYDRPDALKAHERIHRLPFRFECEICAEKFQIQNDLEKHKRKIHKDIYSPKKVDSEKKQKVKAEKRRKSQKPAKTQINQITMASEISYDILAKAISNSQLPLAQLQMSGTELC